MVCKALAKTCGVCVLALGLWGCQPLASDEEMVLQELERATQENARLVRELKQAREENEALSREVGLLRSRVGALDGRLEPGEPVPSAWETGVGGDD